MGHSRLVSRYLLIVGASLAIVFPATAKDVYRKLKDAEIRARLAGMEITDGVHWAEQYMRDGTYKASHMGKPSKGKWHARNDELCVDGKSDFGACREVWLSGNKVEFRSATSKIPPIEGVLQKQQKRE
jgi:hypothetical protein